MSEKSHHSSGYIKGTDDMAFRKQILDALREYKYIEAATHYLDVMFADLRNERENMVEQKRVDAESGIPQHEIDKQIDHAFNTTLNSIMSGLGVIEIEEQVKLGVAKAPKGDYFNRIRLDLDQAKDLVRTLIERIILEFKYLYPGDKKHAGFAIERILKKSWEDPTVGKRIKELFGDWDPFSNEESTVVRMAKGVFDIKHDPRA